MNRFAQFCLGFFFVFVSATVALALPTVTEHSVNGYRVLLINQHKGNRVKFTVQVPTGSWHDNPVYHAGLAHLWEHIIHGGSEKFPEGEKAWAEMMRRSGGDSNAETWVNTTRYFSYGHPDALEDFAQYYGGMMSAPRWNFAAFHAERKVVMNEALAYQAYSKEALESGLFQILLPKGHPLAMYSIGTQEQLAAIEIGDLQDLFYANYRPENMTILIAGNFDSTVDHVPPLDAEKVLNLVRDNFLPPRDKRPHFHRPELYDVLPINKNFPAIVSAENQDRFVEINSLTEDRNLKVFLKSTRPWPNNTQRPLIS